MTTSEKDKNRIQKNEDALAFLKESTDRLESKVDRLGLKVWGLYVLIAFSVGVGLLKAPSISSLLASIIHLFT